MTDIRNDFAPNEGSPEQPRREGQEDLTSALFVDPQMQELLATLMQRRQAPPVSSGEALTVVKDLRFELSEIINQVKAALSEPQRIGFLAAGHGGFSLAPFAEHIKEAAEIFERITLSNNEEPIQRQVAFMVFGLLESFQLGLVNLELNDLTRSDVYGLLPVLQETRQALMEIELKAGLGMFGEKQ